MRFLTTILKDGLMTPYAAAIEQAMKAFSDSLRENDRRRYAAIEAVKLGHGGTEYVARLLGIDPKTIREGRHELRDLPAAPRVRVRRPGGGRKRRIDSDPEIEDDFRAALHDHTAGSPTDEGLIWTDLTAREIAERLGERGHAVSARIAGQLLDEHGYRRRKALRMRPMGGHPDRDAQFEVIAGLKRRYLDSPDPVLSMDLKSRELIGDYFRAGALWTRATIRTFDHDFPEFAAGVALPHGLYDLKLNRGYVHLGTSHDTSELACDCLGDWWARFGRGLYPRAKSLSLSCDGGGSNPADTERCEARLFKADLRRPVGGIGLEVRVAHYPPYASKFDPIEHRVFPHLTRACRGVVFRSVGLVARLMAKARTRSGLSVVVDVVDKVHRTGRKGADAAKRAVRIVRDGTLPRWNYRTLPNV